MKALQLQVLKRKTAVWASRSENLWEDQRLSPFGSSEKGLALGSELEDAPFPLLYCQSASLFVRGYLLL